MKKEKFKNIVKKKIISAALKYLNSLAEGHSKSRPLMKSELVCEKYILDQRLSIQDVQLLFSLRSRMYPVPANYRNQYNGNLKCRLCKMEDSDQEHELTCRLLGKFVPELSTTDVKYSDIFGNVDQQVKATKLYRRIIDKRQYLEETLNC